MWALWQQSESLTYGDAHVRTIAQIKFLYYCLVPYLYAWIKCRSIPAYVKNKKGGDAYIITSKGTVHFPKTKQNNLRQMKKDEMKEESHLNYATIIKYAFCFLVCLFFIK